MISLVPAFGAHTTTTVMLRLEVPGHYDNDNRWQPGGYGKAFAIKATPVPLGDPDYGDFGKILKPDPTGERQPALIKIASVWKIPNNSLIEYGTELYKIIREGDYHAAGFWMAIGATDTTAKPITVADYPSNMTIMRGHKDILVSQVARERYSGK